MRMHPSAPSIVWSVCCPCNSHNGHDFHLECKKHNRKRSFKRKPMDQVAVDWNLGSFRIDDFCSTTPLASVTCLLRMLMRELTDVASRSTTLETAICRRLKTGGREVSFRCFLPILGVFLREESKLWLYLESRWCHRPWIISIMWFLWWKVLKHEKPNLNNCKDRHDTGNEAGSNPLQVAFSTGKLQLLSSLQKRNFWSLLSLTARNLKEL